MEHGDKHPRPRAWDGIIDADEQERYARSGFYKAPSLGKAALLVVDMQYRMLGTRPLPINEAIKEFATSCGEKGWETVPRIRRLCDHFRQLQWPVIHFTLGPRRAFVQHTAGAAVHAQLGLTANPGPDLGFQIINELQPQADEPTICKFGPSAFFGTPTASLLVQAGVSTVCVAGSTTSGCIRATVVDAFSHGLSVLVPDDCVFDRSEVSHGVSLFDMATRYAQITHLEEALGLLQPPADTGVRS